MPTLPDFLFKGLEERAYPVCVGAAITTTPGTGGGSHVYAAPVLTDSRDMDYHVITKAEPECPFCSLYMHFLAVGFPKFPPFLADNFDG